LKRNLPIEQDDGQAGFPITHKQIADRFFFDEGIRILGKIEAMHCHTMGFDPFNVGCKLNKLSIHIGTADSGRAAHGRFEDL
jgi:hypothetical protein